MRDAEVPGGCKGVMTFVDEGSFVRVTEVLGPGG